MGNPILPVEQQLFPILLEWLDPLEGSFAAKANKSDACTSVTGSLNCFLEPKDLSILYLSLEALSTDVTVFPISEIRQSHEEKQDQTSNRSFDGYGWKSD